MSAHPSLAQSIELHVEPYFSPDSSKIIFKSNRDGNDEIYIMKVDGSEQINLTNNQSGDRFPCFSPDGSKIAFESDRDGNSEIYIMDSDGRNQRRLTDNDCFDGYPIWFDPAYVHAVFPAGKLKGTWGWIKQGSK